MPLETKELTKFISESISGVNEAFAEKTFLEKSEGWYFHVFMLKLKGKFGMAVPWIASFTIVPEIELVFQKPFPEGMTTYHP